MSGMINVSENLLLDLQSKQYKIKEEEYKFYSAICSRMSVLLHDIWIWQMENYHEDSIKTEEIEFINSMYKAFEEVRDTIIMRLNTYISIRNNEGVKNELDP